MRRRSRSLLQRGIFDVRPIGVLLVTVALASCSEVPPEYDPISWGNSVRNEVGGWFGAEPKTDVAARIEAPPSEGRPFPNLATVPRPPKVTPSAERQAELERLSRDQAGARDAPQASPPPTPTGSDRVGALTAPPGNGAFSEADRMVLRRAMSEAARRAPGIVRLVGMPDATARVADELTRLGLPPLRTRSESGATGRQVEIFVDY